MRLFLFNLEGVVLNHLNAFFYVTCSEKIKIL